MRTAVEGKAGEKMRRAPIGCKIENGEARIDETATEQIRTLFEAYNSGMSLKEAAAKAGLEGYHSSIGRILKNTRYLGDDYHPGLIDWDTFEKAQLIRYEKAKSLGRIYDYSEKEIAQIAKALSVQQEAFLKATKSKKPYDDIADAIDELRERKQKALTGKVMQEGKKLRIQKLTDFLTGLGQEIKEYDEQMVRRYIERITVRENCYEVAFKAGIKIEIEKQ